MIHAKLLSTALLATVLFAGCASSGDTTQTGPATQASYYAALKDAQLSIIRAAKAHYEWRDTGSILKKADEAAKAGDFETAVKLARVAQKQGDLAYQQSELQKSAGPR